MRLRIDLAYDGGDFHGWARQAGLRTVQGDLETALETALRLPEVAVTCAGRTDTGVHARGQVAHVDVEPEVVEAAAGRSDEGPVPTLRRRLNGLLPADLRVRRVVEAPAGFDARFSALWRRYAYRIADSPEAADPLSRGYVLAWRRPLDLAAMNDASALLLGRRDFARSASSARARPRSAPCSTSPGSAMPPACWWPGCAPTPSATTWSGRWSAASSPWGRVVAT